MFFLGQLVKLFVFAVGVVWCGAILKRLPSDVQDFRKAQTGSSRVILIGMWVVTVLLLIWVVPFAWHLLSGIARLLR